MKGLVADIKRGSFHDGDGVRTTVFLKGCPLSCKWCHNPECLSFEQETLFYPEKCIGCNMCDNGCYSGAKVICGKYYTPNELADELMEDKIYFKNGGGVTFSGGEPMAQKEFLKECVHLLKKKKISCFIETSLIIFDEEILKLFDAVLADFKIFDSTIHKEYTDVENIEIKENFKKFDALNIPIYARTPLIPEINQEIDKISEFLKELENVKKYELLPYHNLGITKAEALNKDLRNLLFRRKKFLRSLKNMLSYDDRIKAVRETKIRHTLEKRKQNGYTDLDDFGTVPIPEDYEVEPWYNSTNGSFYGYDGMSENFCRVINAHPPYVDPMEMLCGRWRDMLVNYRGDIHYLPDWLKKKPKIMELMASDTDQWSKRWDEQRFPYDHLKPLQEKYNIQTGIDGDAHFACDYSIGFELGFGGLLEKIKKYREINPDKKDFYNAEEKCLLAIINFVDRHIEKIKELIKCEGRPEIKENLEDMLEVCSAVRLGAPKTFHQACQWTAFFNCASRIYTRDGAGFQLDTLLYPFYQKDINDGVLTEEKARFLIANLLLIDPHYYQISGVDENDRDLTNSLSYIILEGADKINISCNLTVRVHKNCDKKFFEKAVYYLLKNKNAWPRFCSDENLAKGYMRNGIDKKTARERIAVGCNWMCVPGKEFPMNDTVKINIAKVFEEALKDLKEQKEYSLEKLFSLYEEHLAKAIEVTAEGINLHIDHAAEVTPELIMNLLMHNTLEKGEDISRCAELYTVGVDGAGLAVVADSLGAIEQRIVKEKVLTWQQLFEALENNFSDERTRLILNSAPRYCGGNTVSDKWAVKLTESFVRLIKAKKMPKGRQLIPGWFSWARTIEYGEKVGATPNGRRAGEPISHGANPNPGFRKDSAVTAQSNGIASVQCGYGNTAPLQLEFDPSLKADSEGIANITNLILSHFEQGGTLININVLDKDKLLKAHENPELYPDLVVRVTGFTAYFASLSPKFRQLVVDRFLSE